MAESHIRRSAEIIAFPAHRREAARAINNRTLEAEAARLGSAVDTTGWYHEEAIDEEKKHPRHASRFSWFDWH